MATIRRPEKGDQVRAVQLALHRLGYPITVDGDFGPQTESLVRDFQFRHFVTGAVDERTAVALADAADPAFTGWSARDRVITALTVFGEARGEKELGKAAVVWVILHRAANPRWWGREGPASVCLAPWQFSCWNVGDPNRELILEQLVGGDPERAELTEEARLDRRVIACLETVDKVRAGALPDPTGGADHYHTTGVEPAWSRGREPLAKVGTHLFFRLEDITPLTL